MNVLNKYTLKSLLANKTRTIVTIIGIILSVAMLTAVTTSISSFQSYMIRALEQKTGGWYVSACSVGDSELDAVREDGRVDWIAELEQIGYAPIEGTDDVNPYKPYLCVLGMRDGFSDHIPVVLTSGRLPENTSELVLPEHLFSQTGFSAKVGDTLTLTLGDRVSDGYVFGQDTFFQTDEYDVPLEDFSEREVRTYTVVGICKRPDFEDYSAPGYSALTVGEGKPLLSGAWIRTKSPDDAEDLLNDRLDSASSTEENTDLLRMTMSSGEDVYNRVLWSIGSVLIAVILVASVFLICNAFSISITERTRQFGLLTSVGATRRQTTRCVLFEALALSAVGIPLGLLVGMTGIGVTLLLTSDMFDSIFGGAGVPMRLAVSPVSIILAVVLGLLTVLISAWFPAKRAARMTPIEAIRQSADVKIRSKSVRTGRLTYRLYGFEGMLASKNFKRARKKYRATVISLTVSVVLFITASSFCTYLSDSTQDVLRDFSFDIVYTSAEEDGYSPEQVLDLLEQTEDVTKAAYSYYLFDNPTLSGEKLSPEYIDTAKEYQGNGADGFSLSIGLVLCDDESFAEFAERNGLGEEYLRGEKLAAVNHIVRFSCEEERYKSSDPLVQPMAIELSNGYTADIGCFVRDYPMGGDLTNGSVAVFCPISAYPADLLADSFSEYIVTFRSDNNAKTYQAMCNTLRENGISAYNLVNYAADAGTTRALLTVVNVFSYGFITLISLIALANVFNTISTNVRLRRREFAVLMSVGMTKKSFRRMMSYECLLYGTKGLIFGLPLSVLTTYLLYLSFNIGLDSDFYMPLPGVMIAVVSVFVVVAATILYAMKKQQSCNLIDSLKSEEC